MFDKLEGDYQYFLTVLREAIAAVEDDYYQVDFYGSEEPKYRERVFCYELYHQLRLRLSYNFNYKLHGEMDKKTHAKYRSNTLLRGSAPDFIVHQQSEMNQNLSVIEVKHAQSDLNKILRDIDKLNEFINIGNYHRCILLIYGPLEEESFEEVYYKLSDKIDLILTEHQGHFNLININTK